MPECQCETCKRYCVNNKPGWFIPGEAELTAAYLKLTLKELFDNYLGVDYWAASNNLYLLIPALTNMQAGNIYPFNPFGQCVFYNDEEFLQFCFCYQSAHHC